MEKILKAWLRKNQLAEDSEYYSALVAGSGSIGVMNIIEQMLQEDLNLKKETVVNIITSFNKKSAELVLSGYNVNTGLVYMRPVINDKFHNKTWSPDISSVSISFTQGHDLRQALCETTVKILGEQCYPFEITGIIDVVSGNTSSEFKSGNIIELQGTNMKVVGIYPEVGILFRNVNTQEITKLKTSNLHINEATKLRISLPKEITIGEYELTICTQYKDGNRLFDQPRFTSFMQPIIIT